MSSRNRKVTKGYATLLAWRRAHRFTLQQAADYLDLPLTTYYNFERGFRHPRPDALRRIVDRTGVSLAALVGVA